MTIISSAQSGNWEDASTWVGGIVPALTNDKLIAKDHTVTVTSTVVTENNLKIEGEVIIAKEATLALGTFATQKICTLILAGGTISGEGVLGINWAKLTSTGETWSTIRCHTIKKLPSTSSNFFWSWDVTKVLFKGIVDLNLIQGLVKHGSQKPLYNITNCVIKDCKKITFVQTGGYSFSKDILLKNNSFIDNKSMLVSGGKIKTLTFDTCFFTGGELKFGGTTVKEKITVQNCVNLNCYFWNFNNNYLIENSYFSSNTPTTYTAGLGYRPEGYFNNNIVFTPLEAHNNRSITHCNVSTCFVEDLSKGGSNTFLAQEFPINWNHNILIGISDGFTALTGAGTVHHTIKNNTSKGFCFLTYERTTPTADSVIDIKNNMTTSYTGAMPKGPFFRTINAMKGPTPVYVDYNHKAGKAPWLSEVLVNKLEGAHNVEHDTIDYPQFVDGTRNQERYAKEVLNIEYTNYTDFWKYITALVGYDPATEIHSKEPLPTTTMTHMRTWLMEGYRPQNMSLATAGEGGTYMGALEPKTASGLKVFFNGVTMAKAYFNDQPIPLDKVKFYANL